MQTKYPFFTHIAVVEEDYKNTAGDKMSTDIIAILIYILYIYYVKRTSVEDMQRPLTVSDLQLTLCRYIYKLCCSRWPEYGRVDRFVKRPKTVWKGLELQIDGTLFQKRTLMYRRASRSCVRPPRCKTHK